MIVKLLCCVRFKALSPIVVCLKRVCSESMLRNDSLRISLPETENSQTGVRIVQVIDGNNQTTQNCR